MIEAGPEFPGAPLVSHGGDQPGNRSRDLMSAIASSSFNYYAAFVADGACGPPLLLSRHAQQSALLAGHPS